MKSRRDILKKGAAAATGLTLLSGCSRLENKSSEQNQITIPFEGLGTYENWIEEAQPVGSNYVQEKHLKKLPMMNSP
jgi:hypothetical protein